MKQCRECGSKYADNIQSCPECMITLEYYDPDKEIKEENNNFIQTIYQKINDITIIKKISILIHSLKIYHAVILYIVLIFFVFISYFFGTLKKYDDSYISDIFTMELKQNKFEELNAASEIKKNEETNKNNLNDEITNIQAQIDAVNDFEEKQNDYNAEIENMRIETDNLLKQQEELKAELNNINSQIE